ncbi:hypothetical protein Lal_00019031 [Lupinus albus]|nr:hypothetical protein Lal_00019031 [Lupinus albus]
MNAPKLTHSTTPIRFARGKATKLSDGCVTFGVVVRAPVPNGRMSDPFPCGSWPYHSVPDGQRGIRAAYVILRCAFPLDWTRVSCRKYGSESDFGSPVQAQLLALCWRTYTKGRAGALRSFFLCGTMPGREGNASRRRTTTTQLTTFCSLHP